MKEAFLTRLESSLAKRVTEHAEVFDSNSAFLRLIVRVFFKFMDAGIIRLDLLWLQAVLQENPENLRNRVATSTREPAAVTEPLREMTPLPQRKKSATYQGQSEARATAWKHTSIPPNNFAIPKFAIGYGAQL